MLTEIPLKSIHLLFQLFVHENTASSIASVYLWRQVQGPNWFRVRKDPGILSQSPFLLVCSRHFPRDLIACQSLVGHSSVTLLVHERKT